MPSICPENRLAVYYWGLTNLVGWQMVSDLGGLTMTRHEAADLLIRISTLKSEETAIQIEQLKASQRGGG